MNKRRLAQIQDMRRKLALMYADLAEIAEEAPAAGRARRRLQDAFGALAEARLELGYDGRADNQ